MNSSPAATASSFTVTPIGADQTLPLRVSVLRPGRPDDECVFPGDEHEQTLHVGAFRDGQLLAIASLYLEPRDVRDTSGHEWRLRGMAADPSVRRQGAGAATLAACEQYARAAGAKMLWCNARSGAIAFYEAQGWSVLGEEFDIPTVGPHVVMEKRIG